MKELLLRTIEEAKKDKKKLIAMKQMAVKIQDFELAASLREMEKKFFPETKEEKEAKNKSKELSTIFSMVGLNINNQTCWLLWNTMKEWELKRGAFSLEDAVKIMGEKDDLYFIGE